LTAGRGVKHGLDSSVSSPAPRPKFIVVIPAHDEEPVIADAVKSCLGLDYPHSHFQVVVIADNCSDRTAFLAGRAGARVVERFDSQKKSKGFAIDFLIEMLQKSGEMESIDALVIVDADSTVDPDLLRAFDRELQSGHDWLQAYYTVSNPDDSWRTRLLTYSFSLINGVMPLGKTRLGRSAGFTGNGMCFSAAGLRRLPWQSHGLVEDMEFSWAARIAGEKIVFLPDVSVHGPMLASGGPAAAGQRRRWEFGRKNVRRMFIGPLLRSKRHSIWERLFLFCELTMPTLGTLVFIYLVAAIADVALLLNLPPESSPIGRLVFFSCLSLMSVSLALYAITPFLKLRLPWRYGLSAIALPVLLLWKLRVTFQGHPDQWVRTPRETHTGGSNQLAEKLR
jgi:cellulose synthase/poly-beta-1,6-N-acetylglucosamine synthase-like glycosyltransferase